MALDIFCKQTRDWFVRHVGTPTAVQEAGWPAIASGEHVLISAPTGAGKTLSAFLVFIDRYKTLAREGGLRDELQLLYISPLKALGNDIRENLRRPLDGIMGPEIRVAVRTGDTTPAERRSMVKHPPHILITTPESLYLLLTSRSGRGLLATAKAVILDELHAVINDKRGAHLMLSLARLDVLCCRELQRIGLSATIEPLTDAAAYLATGQVSIIAPAMHKAVDIQVNSPLPDPDSLLPGASELPEGTVWPELARMVYESCRDARTVIAFVENRSHAEKLSSYVNQLGGEGFSRTHHGSISKEQRLEAEQELRSGMLRLLCATSSMELGIDVGEVDLVLQIGNPRTISSTMQRLGRAGHNPGRTSIMHIFPRTTSESVYCGLTARLALDGGIEHTRPPRKCLDVLAQHLVSMAACESYTVDDVLSLIGRTYNFNMVTREEIQGVLRMLAGDFEHRLDHPARPRILYDRLQDTVTGDAYSRILAVSTAGVIPDKGMYDACLEDGTKLGELDEEFVFEARVGDKFFLGAFAWRITEFKRDRVLVAPANTEGAQTPFWKGDAQGRSYQTGVAFGQIFRKLNQVVHDGRLFEELRHLQLDDVAANHAASFLLRQIKATGILPDDRTIIVEHFSDQSSEHQIMVHSVFGRRINGGLALLTQDAARKATGMDITCFDDDDGFIVMPYGGKQPLPDRLLQSIAAEDAGSILEAILPTAPLFNIAFRYNAGRALLMGVRNGRRQPLWVTRLRSAEILDNAVLMKDHPLIAETKRECLEDYLDLAGIERVLKAIASGSIAVREMYSETPSPMALPLRRQAEAAFTYDYFPTTTNMRNVVDEARGTAQENACLPRPTFSLVQDVPVRTRLPEDAVQLHSLLMAEGDLIAGDLDVPEVGEWLETLAEQGRVCYIEPGLWVCTEQREAYEAALDGEDAAERLRVVRRCLRYRGAQDADTLSARYFWDRLLCDALLEELAQAGAAVENDGLYVHHELYGRALRETLNRRRNESVTQPPRCYAALLSRRLRRSVEPAEQLRISVGELSDRPYQAALWESVLLPARVAGYRPGMLDQLLAQGEFYWLISTQDKQAVSFHRYSDMDWEKDSEEEALAGDEAAMVRTLRTRGASFVYGLTGLLDGKPVIETLTALAEKGLAHADSFLPVRQWIEGEKAKKAPPKHRARMRAMTNTAGRWELTRPLAERSIERQLEDAFDRVVLLCRETAQGLNWPMALRTLRIWEYTGKVRRGYFIQGLSGAQFIRDADYHAVMLSMQERDQEILWLNAVDPAQPWGRVLPHAPDASFMCVVGTAVGLCDGQPVAVIERHSALRVFDGERLEDAIHAFVRDYKQKRIYASRSKIILKQYPPEAEAAMAAAGFTREMRDYVLFQSYS